MPDSPMLRRALSFARHEASRHGVAAIEPEHLLLGVCRTGDDTVVELLRRHGVRTEGVRRAVVGERAVAGPIAAAPELPVSTTCATVLELADRQSSSTQAAGRTSEPLCLLLALLEHGDNRAASLLRRHGLDLEAARRGVRSIAAEHAAPREPGRALPFLDRYARDLTALASRGELDPLIGRDREMAQMMRILCQRLRRNPILLGEPGVGKTALVEGLAQRLAEGDVPSPLAGKRVVSLDLSVMVAGTRYRGEFEERLKGVIEELVSTGDRIVFVDEIHTLVGTGSAEGSLDAANILKPALSRGEISCVGATTVKEYRQHVERDRALARRFQAVDLAPPSREEALAVLHGVRDRYEAFHGVRYSEEALGAAVTQSSRYLPERHLPDKALEVLDQAGAWVQIHDELPAGGPRQVGRDVIDRVIALATGIPVARVQADEAERLLELETVLGRRVVGQERAVRALSRSIRRSRLGVRDQRRPIGSFLLVGPSGVGKTELGRRVAEHLFDRREALLRYDMSEYMERHAVAKLIGAPPGYVGFEEGGRLTEAVRRQPYSVLLFDEIEKAHPDLANLLLQILEEGCLTDSQGQRVDFTHTVVLLTSNVGSRLVLEAGHIGFAEESPESVFARVKTEISAELKRVFPPELLNRLDEVLVFEPLSRESLEAILELMLADLEPLFAERGLRVEVTPEARAFILAEAGCDAATGARPLRRAVERWVQEGVSEALVRHPGEAIGTLRVELADGVPVYCPAPPEGEGAEPMRRVMGKLRARGEKTGSAR